MIAAVPATPECLVHLGKAPPREFLNDRLDGLNHRHILGGIRPVAIDRATEVQDLTCSPEAQSVHLPGEVYELSLRSRP